MCDIGRLRDQRRRRTVTLAAATAGYWIGRQCNRKWSTCYHHHVIRRPDTSEDAHALQIEGYRRMGPAARLRTALELTELSRRFLAAGVRKRHPEYDEEQVRLATARLWLGPDLFRRAFPDSPELKP